MPPCGLLGFVGAFGGHPAAGGFTVQATEVAALHERLNGLANDAGLRAVTMPWWWP